MTLKIKGELTDLNSYIDAERSNRFQAAKIKKYETARVRYHCLEQKLEKIAKFNLMTIHWYTKDLRKDADNIAFATKFILDGMKEAGVIPSDGRKVTGSIYHRFSVDAKNPRIEVAII